MTLRGRNFLKQLRRFCFFVLTIEYEITDCQRKLKDKGVLILKKPATTFIVYFGRSYYLRIQAFLLKI